jgi:hypothetical protein
MTAADARIEADRAAASTAGRVRIRERMEVSSVSGKDR